MFTPTAGDDVFTATAVWEIDLREWMPNNNCTKIRHQLLGDGKVESPRWFSPGDLPEIFTAIGEFVKPYQGSEDGPQIPKPPTHETNARVAKEIKKLTTWVTSVLLRIDDSKLHEWQRTYMSIIHRTSVNSGGEAPVATGVTSNPDSATLQVRLGSDSPDGISVLVWLTRRNGLISARYVTPVVTGLV